MTTDDAIREMDEAAAVYDMGYASELWPIIKAALARVTAERDRLIEAWPEALDGTVYGGASGGNWYEWTSAKKCNIGPHPTKAAAVRAAAGLDAKEGA
jgi:hypothetical protein